MSELLTRTFDEPASTYRNVEQGGLSVSVFLSKAPAGRAIAEIRESVKNLRECGLETGPGRVLVQILKPQDWVESWKRHFVPLEIGSALLVRPSWSRKRPRPGQQELVMDPGLSFGTGHHPTTGFCLEQVVAARIPGCRQALLDIGTGSGILAIAAAKLRYRPVAAFDFDPEAVRVARANAHANRVSRAVRIWRQDLKTLPFKSRARYSVICANLLSSLLLEERDRLLARLAPEGTLIVAGVLKTEFPELRAQYESAGLKLVASRSEKEWRSGAFRFRSSL